MTEGPQSDLAIKILKDKSFSSLKNYVSDETLKAIEDMGLKSMTEIQAQCIPKILDGRNLLGAAKTGSGKTLAFLIPVIEIINTISFDPKDGTAVIIISPTRELAMQTNAVLKDLLKYHKHTFGLVMGRNDKKKEAQKLSKGVTILGATPGRLLDHITSSSKFIYRNLQCLIIDEADRLLQDGFEEEMKQILKRLPKERQTLLFSATQTKKTEDLIRLSFNSEPVYVGVDDDKQQATVEGLQQGYIETPTGRRFHMLFTFLKKNIDKKVMVFFSSCMSVQYHHDLLNFIDIPVLCIHGKQNQSKRTQTFDKFRSDKSSIILCTDVAARGLDFEAVDWVVQYDPPDDTDEYIHRVGRTARGREGTGHALLFLLSEEMTFLTNLKNSKVLLKEYEIHWEKISNIQASLERAVNKNHSLHQAAVSGYKGYLNSYLARKNKAIFDVSRLDLKQVAKSFGLLVAPNVDLSGNYDRKKRLMEKDGQSGKNKRRKLD